MKKFIVIFVVALVAGLIGWQVYQKAKVSQKSSSNKHRNVRVAVEIKPVETAAIRDVREFTGTLYPRTQFDVASKINGRLKKLMFNIGDKISPGQLIAVLDDDEFLQQVDQARAELQVAKANLEESRNSVEISKREFDRTVVLRQKKIASESELDTAASNYKNREAKVKVATAQVVQKEATLKMAQVRLSYAKIKMPTNLGNLSGVVGERFVHEGALLAPNKPIVSILDIRFVLAVIHVIERDYANIRVGMDAVISTDAFPGRKFTGKIIRMAPLLKEKSREARVEINVPNHKEILKPGMFVRIQIEFDRRENATVVPIEALIKREGQRGVFVVDMREEKARFTLVTTGIVNGTRAEILNPSLNGFVVTLGQHLLEGDALIILPDDKQKRPEGKRGEQKGKRKSGKKGDKEGSNRPSETTP